MTLDDRVLQAERKAIEDGLAFQRHPTPDHLLALQQSNQTDSWQQLTKSTSHLTSIGSMWHLINKVVKKKAPVALHHSPTDCVQIIDAWSAQPCSL